MFAVQTRKWATRTITIVSSIVLVVVLAVVGIWWITGGLQGLRDRPLKDLLSYVDDINPQEMTAVVCTEARGLCVEGWRTDVGDFQRYATVGEAEYWEMVLGEDGLRNGSVILNMTEVDLSLIEKRQAVDVLFSNRDWN